MCNHGFIFIYSLTFTLLLYNEKAVESSETIATATATLRNKVQSRAENEHIDEMVYILFIISHLFINIYDGI